MERMAFAQDLAGGLFQMVISDFAREALRGLCAK